MLGMRATRSDDTVLEGAFVPDKLHRARCASRRRRRRQLRRRLPDVGAHGFANIYYGLSMRVREVLVEQLKTKTSIALTRPMIYHPEVQHGMAEITMAIEAMGPHIEAVAKPIGRKGASALTGSSRSSR